MCQTEEGGGVEHLGPVTSQAVFPLAVLVGLVTSVERASYGYIATGNPVSQKTCEFEKMTRENLDSLLTGFAMRLKQTQSIAECLWCEDN